MERQKDGWPSRFEIIKPLALLERLIGRVASREVPNTGATVMLDEALDEDVVIDLRQVVPEETQLMLDYWTCEQ